MTWQAAVLIATALAFLALWLRELQAHCDTGAQLVQAIRRIESLSEALSAADDEEQQPRPRARTLRRTQ